MIWDLRLEPPFERAEGGGGGGGGGGFRGGQPNGPRVLPGTYTVRLEAGAETTETSVDVRLDPRVQISRADLMTRQDALMSVHRMAGPSYEAGQAVQRVTGQLREIRALVEGHDGAPESLLEEISELQDRVRDLGQELNSAGGGRGGGGGSVESSYTAPTADQLWQIEQSWEKVPPLIGQLNQIHHGRDPGYTPAVG